MGLGSEEAKRARLAAISPESKERAQFENRLAIQRSLAENRARTDAMFGPTSLLVTEHKEEPWEAQK
jgi:hypothetical protein